MNAGSNNSWAACAAVPSTRKVNLKMPSQVAGGVVDEVRGTCSLSEM